jgi:hypothetical protein
MFKVLNIKNTNNILLTQTPFNFVRFEVSTAVTMIIIFWEMTPCGSYKNRRFGGSYRLHLQVNECELVTERSC